ncbi:MAG: DUF4350 domain-containing protein [Bacteroidia bacterium]|nr:DUF4350 domain-containing protein [Bacteroidia bacterium]
MKDKFGPVILSAALVLLIYGLGAGGGDSGREKEFYSFTSRERLGYYAIHKRIGDVLGAKPEMMRAQRMYALLDIMGVVRFGGKIGEIEFSAIPRRDKPGVFYETESAVAVGDTLVEYWEEEDSSAELDVNLVVFAPGFNPGGVEKQILRRFLERGGNVFVSAKSFSRSLLFRFGILASLKDTFAHDPASNPPHYSELRLVGRPERVRVPDFGSFFYFEPELSSAQVWGVDERGKANFVVLDVGKGRMALHSAPHVFANRYFLSPEGERYVAAALNSLPAAARLVWDDSHNHIPSDSILRVVMADPKLKTACYLLFLGAALFMLFAARRIVRPIPIVERPRNTAAEFVQTLAKLYFNRGDHANIARKRIDALRFFLRERYSLDADEPSVPALSEKTGVEKSEIERLFALANQMEKNEHVSQEDLARLNRAIETFYSKLSI